MRTQRAIVWAMCSALVGCQIVGGISVISSSEGDASFSDAASDARIDAHSIFSADAAIDAIDAASPMDACAACGASQSCVDAACVCAATQSTCGTTNQCFTLATDPANCGVCGHSCGGGMCKNNVCQPQLIYSGGASVEVADLVLAPPYIYFLPFVIGGFGGPTTGDIDFCPLSGCGANNENLRTLVPSVNVNTSFSIGGGKAYWSTYIPTDGGVASTIYSCTLNAAGACGGAPSIAATTPNRIAWITASASGGAFYSYTVYGESATVGELAMVGSSTTLALDSSIGQISISSSLDTLFLPSYGGMYVVPVSLASEMLLGAPQQDVSGAAIVGDTAYWTLIRSEDAGAIVSYKNGVTTTLVGGRSNPESPTTDGVRIYWNEQSPQVSLYYCSLADCVPTLLALPGTSQVQSDGSFIYWDAVVEAGTEAIYRMPAPQ